MFYVIIDDMFGLLVLFELQLIFFDSLLDKFPLSTKMSPFDRQKRHCSRRFTVSSPCLSVYKLFSCAAHCKSQYAFRPMVELTIHQRLTRAFDIGGVDVNEKPSRWMARFRHASGDWTRDDVVRWALLRRLPSSLRTAL